MEKPEATNAAAASSQQQEEEHGRTLYTGTAVLFRWYPKEEEWLKISRGKLRLLDFGSDRYVVSFHEQGTGKLRAHYNVANRFASMALSRHPQGRTVHHRCLDFSGEAPQERRVAYQFPSEEEMEQFEKSYQTVWDTTPSREITVKDLIDDLIVEPGKGVITFRHQPKSGGGEEQFVVADLDAQGRFHLIATNEVADTPTRFVEKALHQIHVTRGPGNGWMQALYKGQSLGHWRQVYLQRQRPDLHGAPASEQESKVAKKLEF
ncbi:hypothetical protein QOT17_000291 [Balamuthia mandrillaris]